MNAETTVFFKDNLDCLDQKVDVIVESRDDLGSASLKARIAGVERESVITRVVAGRHTYSIYIPEVRADAEATFLIEAAGGVVDVHKTKLLPRKRWEVIFVPLAHHDYGYTDPIEELLPLYDDFYDSVREFLHETADWPKEARYRYTVETSWSLSHYLANRDEKVILDLMEHARLGRFEVSALFANVVDVFCNHEELIRSLYPSFRIRSRYGIPITTASIVDIPGMSWSLPQVLAHAGIRYLFAGFPTYFDREIDVKHSFWDEKSILRQEKPDAFEWAGPDGSSVLTYYQKGYGFMSDNGRYTAAPRTYEELLDLLPTFLDKMENNNTPFSVMRYLFRGRDNQPPNMDICYFARKWNVEYAYPKVIVGTNAMFFRKLEPQCVGIKTISGELTHTDYPLSLSSAVKETVRSRLAHNEILTAESLATVNHLLSGAEYPQSALREIYDDLILYDEHCFGMMYPLGKIHDWNWSSKSHHAYRASARAQRISMHGMIELVENVEVREEGLHITVFNPLAFERSDYVSLSILDRPDISVLRTFEGSSNIVEKIRKHAFTLVDEDSGEHVPFQAEVIDDHRLPLPYAESRYSQAQRLDFFDLNLTFYIENLPALGWKTLRLDFNDSSGSRKTESSVTKIDLPLLENDYYRVEIDPGSGAVARIYDKEDDLELVDNECEHGLNQVITRLVDRKVVESARAIEILPGVAGAIYSNIFVRSTMSGCPNIMQEIRVHSHIKRIDLSTRILKDATPFQEVFVAFPFSVENPRFQFEGSTSPVRPFEDQIEGSNTHHYTVQSWARVYNESKDIVLAPVEAHTLEFGGLWPSAVSQAHHCKTPEGFVDSYMNPADIDKGHIYSFVINSNHKTNFHPTQVADTIFRYSITSSRSPRELPVRFGWRRKNPPIGMFHQKTPGPTRLPGSLRFCSVEPDNINLATIKKAEEGDAIILRLIETAGESARAVIRLPHIEIFAAYEANIVEKTAAALTCTRSEIEIDIEPFGIRTIRLELERDERRIDGLKLFSFH